MGWKLHRSRPFRPRPNQEVELCIELERETRAAIHGKVTFPGCRPVRGAIVKLFEKCDGPCDLVPVTFAFTDKCGQFLFGVDSEKVYVVKVFWFEPERKQACMDDIFCDDPHH